MNLAEDNTAMIKPPAETVERWAWDYIVTEDAGHKLNPPTPPSHWENDPPVRRLSKPGRPSSWRLIRKAPRSRGPNALQHKHRRAEQFHTFLHHELQAAELMAWAILAFPQTPRAFRRGLLRICCDELRHMQLYEEHMHTLGAKFGDFPIRDWFWLRMPAAQDPAQFVAFLGIGLEGGNLDHAKRYADRLRAAGDWRAAAIQEQVGHEEIAHVRFACHWFRRFRGLLNYSAWCEALPERVDPSLLRGDPLNARDRLAAGMPQQFLQDLVKGGAAEYGSDR